MTFCNIPHESKDLSKYSFAMHVRAPASDIYGRRVFRDGNAGPYYLERWGFLEALFTECLVYENTNHRGGCVFGKRLIGLLTSNKINKVSII